MADEEREPTEKEKELIDRVESEEILIIKDKAKEHGISYPSSYDLLEPFKEKTVMGYDEAEKAALRDARGFGKKKYHFIK